MLALSSCGGKETPESVSKKWCEMTAKLEGKEGADREKLVDERKEFEKTVEKAHEKDEAFMDKVKELTRACDK